MSKKKKPPQTNKKAATDSEITNSISDIQHEEIKHLVKYVRASFSGPVPPPDMLREYEKILPGSADRLFRLTENEQNKNGQHITESQKNDKRRIYCTTLISFFIVAAAILAIWLDYSLEGVFIILASLFPTFLKELLKFFAKAP